LNALLDGGTAYVIDFPVTHFSAGRTGSVYEEARSRFVDAWKRRFIFALVRTPNELLYLSRSKLVLRVLGSERTRAWVRAWAMP
jgi:hypothetical protein